MKEGLVPEGFEAWENLPFIVSMVGQNYQGFEAYAGPFHHRQEGNTWLFRFCPQKKHCNGIGKVHGGMLATMIDHVLGGVAFHAVGGRPCLTVSMTLNYLATASEGEWIEGHGEIMRRTNSLIFLQGELTSKGKKLVSASGVWRPLDP